jgi:hypothetical protein
MDKAKIAKLCNEIEDIACDISQQTMNDIVSAESNKAKEIAAEITAPPKSNADRIRQMTDEEISENISFIDCSKCPLCNTHCEGHCREKFLEWLKQEVNSDAGTD